jgi:hypothetical protein
MTNARLAEIRAYYEYRRHCSGVPTPWVIQAVGELLAEVDRLRPVAINAVVATNCDDLWWNWGPTTTMDAR